MTRRGSPMINNLDPLGTIGLALILVGILLICIGALLTSPTS